MTQDEDEWQSDIESTFEFITSQIQIGDVIDQEKYDAIQKLVKALDDKENHAIDEFVRGQEDAYLSIGGEDLLTAVKLKDEERIAKHVRKFMDKLFPPETRKLQ